MLSFPKQWSRTPWLDNLREPVPVPWDNKEATFPRLTKAFVLLK